MQGRIKTSGIYFDTEPTENSNNAVTSQGIKKYLPNIISSEAELSKYFNNLESVKLNEMCNFGVNNPIGSVANIRGFFSDPLLPALFETHIDYLRIEAKNEKDNVIDIVLNWYQANPPSNVQLKLVFLHYEKNEENFYFSISEVRNENTYNNY